MAVVALQAAGVQSSVVRKTLGSRFAEDRRL